MKGILLTEVEYKGLLRRVDGNKRFADGTLICASIMDKIDHPMHISIDSIYKRIRESKSNDRP